MIHKISSSTKDHEHLSQRLPTSPPAINFDYRGLVVKKPWGYEYLLFENRHVAVWVLFLNQGHKTSMHCHPQKKTSLLVLSGEVETSTLENSFRLKALEGLMIGRKVFHSTMATSPEGAVIMEVETPPIKNDLVRLNDAYGRENKGYEGIADISFETDGYEYCYFEPASASQKGNIKKRDLHVHTHESGADLLAYLEKAEKGVMNILQGTLSDAGGNLLAEPGDALEIDELKSHIGKGGKIDPKFITLYIS